jgi:hypothetical protein
MTTREIAAPIGELYGTEISPDLVSAVTDAVLEEVTAWQSGGLEAIYASVFFDAIRVSFATKEWSTTGRCTWRLECAARATRKSLGFGLSRPKARNSGCG